MHLEGLQLKICFYIIILALFEKDLCFIPSNRERVLPPPSYWVSIFSLFPFSFLSVGFHWSYAVFVKRVLFHGHPNIWITKKSRWSIYYLFGIYSPFILNKMGFSLHVYNSYTLSQLWWSLLQSPIKLTIKLCLLNDIYSFSHEFMLA